MILYKKFNKRYVMGSTCCKILWVLVLIGIFREAHAQTPRLVIPTGQSSGVTEIQFSPNGRYLLTGEMGGTIVVWDVPTRREVLRFAGHKAMVFAIAVSPDEHTVVSGDSYGNVLWWNLATGRLLKRLSQAHSSGISSINFSRDGKQLLTADVGGSIAIWAVEHRTVLKTYKNLNFCISKVCFSSDGTRFLSVAPDSSKRDGSSNLTYSHATPDSLTHDINLNYRTALFKDACLLPSGGGLAVVTGDPAELRLYSLQASGAVIKIKLPARMVPFAIEPLDSAHMIIGAICSSDSLAFLRYDVKQKLMISVLVLPHTQYNDGSMMRVIPHTSGREVALGRQGDSHVLRFFLNTGQKDELNPRIVGQPQNVVLSGDHLYTDGINDWDLRAGQLQYVSGDNLYRYIRAKVGDSLLYWFKGAPGYWSIKGKCSEMGNEVPEVHYYEPISGFISPDCQYTVHMVDGGNLQLRLRRDNSLYCTIQRGPADKILGDVAWIGLNTLACQLTGDSTVLVFDVQQKRIVRRLTAHNEVLALEGLPDGSLMLCHAYGLVTVYEPLNGKKTKELKIIATESTYPAVKYEAALNAVRLSYADGSIYLLDPVTLQVRQTWIGHRGFVRSFTLSADRHKAFTASSDGSIRVWDVVTGYSQLSLKVLRHQDWVAFNEDGLFDATPAAMKLAYYVVNDSIDFDEPWKIIELNQLKARYYQPDLMRIVLGYSTEKLREVPRLEKVDLAPKVSIRLINFSTLSIVLRNQRGGIGTVSVYLDDAEIVADARPLPVQNANQVNLAINLNLQPFASRFYPGHPNLIRVVAWNRDHWISATPVTVAWTAPPVAVRGLRPEVGPPIPKGPPPKLYALVVGVSDYAGTQADLRYASKDAGDFAAALRGAAGRLYGTSSTDVSLYNSEQVDTRLRPSRASIESWFDNLASKIKPWDVLVVYLAGHGVSTSGGSGDFYYLTQEATRADAEGLADPAVRDRCAVSSQELTSWLNRLACRKKVLILDACAAGRAAETMAVAARDMPASQVRALDRLTERTGFYILSGSAAEAVSYESEIYSQGLLTYALLKAFKGAALRPDGGEEYVDVQRLLQYAVDEVPQLAKNIGNQQKPLFRSPDSQQSFDLGRVDASLKAAITLAEPKPVFTATSFMSTVSLFDELGLSTEFNAQLRELTSRGKESSLAFTEARDYPGAYHLSGTYERVGLNLRLHYVVVHGTERMLTPQVFEGNFNDPAEFATLFLAQLLPRLR